MLTMTCGVPVSVSYKTVAPLLGLSLFAALLITPSSAEGQRRPETLVGKHFHSSGFGGPVMKMSEVNNEFAVFVGGRGGWLIDQTFVLGGGGYGLVTDVETGLVDDRDEPVDLSLGYGGVQLEYLHDSWELVHFSLAMLIGGGGATLDDRRGDSLEDDGFFVLEPEVNMNLNVTEFFRIGVGAGYRWVNGVDLTGLDDSDLSAVAGTLTFRFGGF